MKIILILLISAVNAYGQSYFKPLFPSGTPCQLVIPLRKLESNLLKDVLKFESVKEVISYSACQSNPIYELVTEKGDTIVSVGQPSIVDFFYQSDPKPIFDSLKIICSEWPKRGAIQCSDFFKSGAIVMFSAKKQSLRVIWFNDCAEGPTFKKIIGLAKTDRSFDEGIAIYCGCDWRTFVNW